MSSDDEILLSEEGKSSNLPIRKRMKVSHNGDVDSCRAQKIVLETDIRDLVKLRPRAIGEEGALDILLLARSIELREINEFLKQPDGKLKRSPIRDTVSSLLSRSKDSVSSLLNNWKTSRDIILKAPACNTVSHASRLRSTPRMHQIVHECFKFRRSSVKPISAGDILDEFVRAGIMSYSLMDRRAKRTALRCVQRFLTKNGYTVSSKLGNGTGGYAEPESVRKSREDYVLALRQNRRTGEYRCVCYHIIFGCHDDARAQRHHSHTYTHLCFSCYIVMAEKCMLARVHCQ